MRRRPPQTPRSYILFPYTVLCLSRVGGHRDHRHPHRPHLAPQALTPPTPGNPARVQPTCDSGHEEAVDAGEERIDGVDDGGERVVDRVEHRGERTEDGRERLVDRLELGRAECRERVCKYV